MAQQDDPLEDQQDEASRETQVTRGEVLVAGAPVHWLDAGEARDGRPPVLLLHGARFRASTWLEPGTFEVLANAGYRVVAIDLPGYGDSPDSDLPRDQFLGRLLDALELPPPVVVSPSMSGSFSLPAVVATPERFAGFVPVAPAGVDAMPAWPAERAAPPTRVVWGDADRVFPSSQAPVLAAKIPGATVAIVEGAGHPCYLDQPEAFHRQLLEFLEGIGPR